MTGDAPSLQSESLKFFEPLCLLSPARLQELATLVTVESVGADELIYEGNVLGKEAIYLLDGQADVAERDSDAMQRVEAGSQEARQCLVDPKYRGAFAVANSTVLRIDNEVLDLLLAWEQFAEAEAREAMAESAVDNSKFLNKYHKSFRQIPVANIDELFRSVEPIPVREGEVIIREGDEGDYFYLIEYGTALVTRDDGTGQQLELATLGEGASFGEDALLTSKPRNATITMLSNGVLMRLGKEEFLALLEEPDIAVYDPVTAQQQVNGGAVWLDVRNPLEYRHNRLQQAVNLPLQDLRTRNDELDRELLYIAYCNTGRRSDAAAHLLGQFGFRVGSLQGGIYGL